jgi:sarcosine dehydrogenase
MSRTTFEFQLFDDDYDHFEQHMSQAIARVPALAVQASSR